MAVTNNIREIREQRGIYQDDLASAIGYSTKTVGRIERGDSTPSAEFMLRISKYFNMLSFRFCYRVDEFPETHGIPEFSRIAVILRFLAGFTDYPGDIVIGNFRFPSTAFVIT